jgi:hypothetical protein
MRWIKLERMVMNGGSGRHKFLQIIFVLIAFIAVVKRESEINTSLVAADICNQTLISYVLPDKVGADQETQYHPAAAKNSGLNRSYYCSYPHCALLTFQATIKLSDNIVCNISQFYSPLNRIIDTLQRQHIWHSCAEDSTDPLIC